jgi:hypothetical protein
MDSNHDSVDNTLTTNDESKQSREENVNENQDMKQSKKKGKKKKRKSEKHPGKYCVICDKKLKITSTKCRCGNKYCSLHRLPEDHLCSFDYKISDHKLYERTHGLGGGLFNKVLKI